MDQLFGSLKSLFKTDSARIDNNIFRLHYKITVIVLVAFSLLVTGRQYIGDPIDCMSRDDIPPWSLRYDPMIRVFPRLTKCTFHRFGPSGDVQRHDSMCVLPINIVNEKIYVFLWFWFVILAVLSGIVLLYRALNVVLPRLRFAVLRSRARFVNKSNLEVVMDRCEIGDWMMINLLSKNLDPLSFRDLIADFARRLESKPDSI